MVSGSLAALNAGATAVFPAEGYSATRTLRAIDEQQCTSVYGVPAMFNSIRRELLKNRDLYNLDSLKRGLIAGAICPKKQMEKYTRDLGIDFLSVAYGTTETSPICSQTRKSDSFDKKISTVGMAHPHTEIKISDENGVTLRRGDKGEI